MIAHSPELMYYAFEHSESNWNLAVLVFKERGKPEYPGEKLLEQRNLAHIWSELRIEPGPHRWETPLRQPCSPYARAFCIYPNFIAVPVLSTMWNDLFCSCIDNVSTWQQIILSECQSKYPDPAELLAIKLFQIYISKYFRNLWAFC